ncbi:MAG TPA: ClbS/DfsB family four-helix bundle protein [Candidatus Woesebacteria bacterium]|nr:ClbS/DfsB family four-helix bundle protein [Candidatus Woesebacteria bacterium]
MPRAQNKQQLLEFGQNEFDRLMNLVNALTPEIRDKQFVFDNRTTKDIIAHLLAWQLLELNWYQEGMNGKKPAIPAPGYTFKDAPELNEKLFQEYKSIEWNDLIARFNTSHKALMSIVNKHSDEELSTKKKYAWTGSTSITCYLASALSSHYVWAIDLIRKKI